MALRWNLMKFGIIVSNPQTLEVQDQPSSSTHIPIRFDRMRKKSEKFGFILGIDQLDRDPRPIRKPC